MLHTLQRYMCYNADIAPNALSQVFLAPYYLGKPYEYESWSLVLNRAMWLAPATVWVGEMCQRFCTLAGRRSLSFSYHSSQHCFNGWGQKKENFVLSHWDLEVISFHTLTESDCNKCIIAYLCTHIWWRKWQPTPVFLPGKFHRLRRLIGYSPWGCKESDTTERFHFHFLWGRKYGQESQVEVTEMSLPSGQMY